MKKLYVLLNIIFCLGTEQGWAQLTLLHNFKTAEGVYPFSSLTMVGNLMYGTAEQGGAYGLGSVFSIKPDGSRYRKLHDFDGGHGGLPCGAVTYSNGVLYGTTNSGGAHGVGTVFSMDTNGNNYQVLHDFGGPAQYIWPLGSLTLSGNTLFGTVSQGGPNQLSRGAIFSIDTNGNAYKVLHDFDSVHGGIPEGSLTMCGNKLFGMAAGGGPYNAGCVFTIDTSGNGYKDLFDFNGQDGGFPGGDLTLSGGQLFGMTSNGALNGDGDIFSIDTNGGGFKKLFDFNGINGLHSGASLILSGNLLYGMTYNGGVNHGGNIFSIDTTGGGFTVLLNFDTANGLGPRGSLIQLGNLLYGTTQLGGVNDSGVIFRYNTFCNLNITNTSSINYYCNSDTGKASVTLSGGTPPYTYLWAPGGQTTDTAALLSAGTYTVTVTDFLGCRQTDTVSVFSLGATLTVKAIPDTINAGDTSHLSAISAPSAYYYKWSNGATTQNINVTPLLTTTYTVTDSTMCGIDTAIITVYVNNCTNNYNEPICILTIDTATNKSMLIWGRTNSPPQGGYGFYLIYRDSNAQYNLVHSQPLNVLSEYIDTSSNPSQGPESYELSTLDSCGESLLSAPHTSIYLTTFAGPNVYILNWTPYIGFTPSEYRIFRGPSMNSLVQIDSVPNNVFTYHDTLAPLNSIYLLEAVNPSSSCIPSQSIGRSHRLSNILLSGSYSNGFNTRILNVQTIGTEIANLNIYPNPGKGIISIGYTMTGSSNIRISIMDELGQVVYDNTEKRGASNFKEELNLDYLVSGIYTLRMQTNKGISVRKVVILR